MADLIYAVGGTGDGSAADDLNGGFAAASALTVGRMYSSYFMTANGGPKLAYINATVTVDIFGVGVLTVLAPDQAWVAATDLVGWYLYHFSAAAAAAGHTVITAKAADGSTISFTMAGGPAVRVDVTINISGALETLSAAMALTFVGSDSEIWMSAHPAVAAQELLNAGGGLATANAWVDIIGCSNTGVEIDNSDVAMVDRTHVEIAAIAPLGDALVEIDDIENLRFHHIKFNAGSTAAGDNGVQVHNGAAHYNYVFEDCKAYDCRYGFFFDSTNARNVALIDCFADTCDIGVVDISSAGVVMIGCMVLNPLGNYGVQTSYHGVLINCVIDSGAFSALYSGNSYTITVLNSTLVTDNAHFAAVFMGHADQALVLVNCIIDVYDSAADNVVFRASGSIHYTGYNATNADTFGSDFSASSSDLVSQTITFADAASGDYTLVNTLWRYMECGLPNTNAKGTHIGAVGKPPAFNIIDAAHS